MKSLSSIIHRVRMIQKETPARDLIQDFFGASLPLDKSFLSLVGESLIAESVVSVGYEEVLDLHDRPNKDAKIAFLIFYPFQYYIYRNIAAFLPESEFVIDALWIRRNVRDWKSLLLKFYTFMNREHVHFRIYSGNVNPEDFFSQYEILVSNARTPTLDLFANERKKKVRVMYGHSKDVWNFGAWSRAFDLALTYGSYGNSFISLYTKSVIVGNARFDRWFSGNLDQHMIDSLRVKLDSSKKTVLYVPTHGNLASLEIIVSCIPKLLDEFNVIIRPHPLTLYTEPERFEAFKRQLADSVQSRHIVWDDDFSDLPEVLSVADVILFDNSGAIFDALLADKRMVLLDFIPDDFIEEEIKNIYQRLPDMFVMPSTYRHSIEQRIKHESDMKIGEVVTNPAELRGAVLRALGRNKAIFAKRRRVKKMLFSFYDGSSGKRSAKAIRALLGTKITEKTLAALQLEIEISSRVKYAYDDLEKLRKSSNYYFNIIPFYEEPETFSGIEFSIVIPTFNRNISVSQTIKSLLLQRGVALSEYEILIIDDGSQDQTPSVIKQIIDDHPEYNLRYIRLRENHGVSVARNVGILQSRGRFIAFTDDDCVVPNDWLVQFRNDFLSNPEIAGSGGYLTPIFSDNGKVSDRAADRVNIWSRFLHLRKAYKSSRWHQLNNCGDTGNVCYRRSALFHVGGFNPFFRFSTTEDWELKARMHAARFALYYNARCVRHLKTLDFPGFLGYWALRGWGSYLMASLNPWLSGFNYSLGHALGVYVDELMKLFRREPDEFFSKSYIEIIKFSFLLLAKYFMLWIGKYWVPIFLLPYDRREKYENRLGR